MHAEVLRPCTMEHKGLIPHLFRIEYSKIVSVLFRRFFFPDIETAEDIAGDTFLAAAQTWSIRGIPENPTAWLYHVAKNKARNHLKRDAIFDRHNANPEGVTDVGNEEVDLSPRQIQDSQLRMMFAICHPSLSEESQIALSLRILCGFGVNEIADAFLTGKETINKRLYRARERLRAEQAVMEFPGEGEIDRRLETVLRTIYLLFNEGYYSSARGTVRRELCLEAIRLGDMLTEDERTDRPDANALLALMCFHASRLEARVDGNGDFILYADQDPDLWNNRLIERGAFFLHRASVGEAMSRYHLEAAIAYWHTRKADTKEKWENILRLYDRLLLMDSSPVVVLNRSYALAKVAGKRAAIAEVEGLPLSGNPFHYMLLGDLYGGIDNEKARNHFLRALELAKTVAERRVIQKRLSNVAASPGSEPEAG